VPQTDLEPSPWEYAARYFEPHPRPYGTPLALARALDRKVGDSPALILIDEELAALRPNPDIDALAVFMPPQEGKSQLAARAYPKWALEDDPALRQAIVSYEQDIALRWGRDIKQDIALNPCKAARPADCDRRCGGLHITIRRDSAAAGRWETPEGGGVYCVGVGGPLTGRPVDILIIDDPVKDRAAAESKVIRQATWDWWESVALTRLAPGGKVVLIQTRWHEDDLAGRILSRPSPLRWRVISIPAIAGEGDVLGRQPGEELQSVRGRQPGYFANLRATMSGYVFSGVYQQTPTAAEGNFFRRAAFRYWRPAAAWPDGRERLDCEGQPVTLADCWRFATIDVAASTKTTADYTVVAAWAITLEGDLVLLDRARARVEDHDQFGMVAPLRARWGLDTCFIEQSWFARTLVQDAQAAGVPVAPLTADTDKVTRAIPAAGRVHQGKVWFPAEAPWLDEWCDELAVFPQGAHDDQVDVLAYAARVVAHEWAPPRPLPRPGVQPWERAVAMAAESATGHAGNGHGDLDIMNLDY
jgi:predicted phage terminase large subunit-like protein